MVYSPKIRNPNAEIRSKFEIRKKPLELRFEFRICFGFRYSSFESPRRRMMKDTGRLVWLCAGLVLGGLGTFLATGTTRVAQAATHDRYDDFIMCTGPASLFPGVSLDGLWLLD